MSSKAAAFTFPGLTAEQSAGLLHKSRRVTEAAIYRLLSMATVPGAVLCQDCGKVLTVKPSDMAPVWHHAIGCTELREQAAEDQAEADTFNGAPVEYPAYVQTLAALGC